MISPVQKLPLLIKEKVEYYYYLGKWKDSTKIMNNQYKEKLQIFDGEYCFYNYQDFYDRVCVFQYIEVTSRGAAKISVANISKYYHYSSALDDPDGYNNIFGLFDPTGYTNKFDYYKRIIV